LICITFKLKYIFCYDNDYKPFLLKIEMEKKGRSIPVLHASGDSIPEAWENSVVELYNKGLWWHREGPKDKGRLTLDSTMTIEIRNPDSDLIGHKYMTTTFEALVDYQMEILGSKDAWVHPEIGSTKWPYHYHERLASYPGTKGLVNQVERVIEGLSAEPWKRRHNMITWSPERDLDSNDPPCLQRIWFGITPDSDENSFVIDMNYNFRSRNVMIASPMNMIGLNTAFSYIVKEVKKSGIKIRKGGIVDFTDSYHVSAQDKPLLTNFIDLFKKSREKGETSEQRCYTKENIFSGINMEAIKANVLEQTKKELEEKGELNRLEEEIEKVNWISKYVSLVNQY
jgi:thymidylate synthase